MFIIDTGFNGIFDRFGQFKMSKGDGLSNEIEHLREEICTDILGKVCRAVHRNMILQSGLWILRRLD